MFQRLAVVTSLAFALTLHGGGAGAEPAAAAFGADFFSGTSAWNTPIPDDPALDPASAAMVSRLARNANALLYEFGQPIYYADASTPRYRINCTRPWGTCGLEHNLVPIPDGARPHAGSDGAMVVVDRASGKSYEFWQARRTSSGWRASWGGVTSIRGDGTDPGLPTGAGVSRLAGVVRLHEIRDGHIPHALAFSTGACAAGEFRYPATKTDGTYSGPGAVPEGARIQLDPSINVDAIRGITPGERAVAHALQTYGAYAIDCGGNSRGGMGFSFELPTEGVSNPYPVVGFPWDYYHMPHIPWNRLRVLRSWTGR